MEFYKVDQPKFFPAACIVCGSQEGPQADTLVDTADRRRVYLCYRCVRTAALVLGWTHPDEVAAMRLEWAEQVGRADRLEAELEAEKESKFTVLAQEDLQRLIADSQRAAEPVCEPMTTICTARKRNGEPCLGAALPGRDVCVAHSKPSERSIA